MAKNALKNTDFPETEPIPELVLPLMREYACSARTAKRLDLFRACAVLSLREHPSGYDFADAVARTLDQALGRSTQWNAPEDTARSFDERWLVTLLERSRDCDSASVAFMIASRVPQSMRNSLAYLVNGLAERLEAVA